MPSAPLPRFLAGFLLYLSLLVSALWLAWQLLVPVNFAYPLAYEVLDIDQHVATFGPQNRYKNDFALTTAREQKRLFGEIVKAIQHGGKGLREIAYITTGGQTHTLLREAETVHLQDVANLITLLDRASWVCLAILAGTLAFMRHRNMPAPRGKQILLGAGGFLLTVGVILLAFGPTQTFYWLHTQIFPEDHEWFFYYQDSLMTTLMKAPDLFGFIAGLWGLVAIALFGLGHWIVQSGIVQRGWALPRDKNAHSSP